MTLLSPLFFLSSRKKDFYIVFGILNFVCIMGTGVFFITNLFSLRDDLTLATLAAGEKSWEAVWVWNRFGSGFCFFDAALHTYSLV